VGRQRFAFSWFHRYLPPEYVREIDVQADGDADADENGPAAATAAGPRLLLRP
jgi:hypothetical protein